MVINKFLAISKALSDKHRVRALMALRGGELCVCQLIELLSLAPSTVSKHMSILRSAGLVECRKDSRWVYYRLPERGADELVSQFIILTTNILDSDEHISSDDIEIKRIQNTQMNKICQID
jgi:ArsR family transcriptional regulator